MVVWGAEAPKPKPPAACAWGRGPTVGPAPGRRLAWTSVVATPATLGAAESSRKALPAAGFVVPTACPERWSREGGGTSPSGRKDSYRGSQQRTRGGSGAGRPRWLQGVASPASSPPNHPRVPRAVPWDPGGGRPAPTSASRRSEPTPRVSSPAVCRWPLLVVTRMTGDTRRFAGPRVQAGHGLGACRVTRLRLVWSRPDTQTSVQAEEDGLRGLKGFDAPGPLHPPAGPRGRSTEPVGSGDPACPPAPRGLLVGHAPR